MLGIFLDIETTGLDSAQHAPIDIAFKILDLKSGKEITEYQSLIKQTLEVWEKSDPSSLSVNGYTFERIQQGKDLEIVKKEIIEIFTQLKIERKKAFFVCQNPSFDRAFFSRIVPVYTQESLNWPYHWLDLASMYWVRYLDEKGEAPDRLNLSKNAIASKYHIGPEAEPHLAINGVDHLIQCYLALFSN